MLITVQMLRSTLVKLHRDRKFRSQSKNFLSASIYFILTLSFRNHLKATGDFDFKTNNSANYHKLSIVKEKAEKLNRDTLKTATDKLETGTTSKDYKVKPYSRTLYIKSFLQEL